MRINDWTELLRDRLADRKVKVDDSLWNNIEKKLDSEASNRRRTKIVMLRVWSAAAAIAAVVVIGTGYYLKRGRQVSINFSSCPMAATGGSQVALGGKSIGDNVSVSDVTGQSDVHRYVSESYLSSTTTKPDVEGRDVWAPDNADNVSIGEIQDKKTSTSADNSISIDDNVEAKIVEKTVVGSTQGSRQTVMPMTDAELGTASTRRHSDAGKLDLGLLASNSFGKAGGTNGVMMTNNTLFGAPMGNLSSKSNVVELANHSEEKHHSHPVSFGLTASYYLTDRIAVHSGLVYTSTSSEFVHISANSEVADNQELHYIGIPLSASYQIWGNRFLKTYVMAGGQADFNVKAFVETEGTKTDIKKDNVQFSVGATVGVEFSPVPQLGIYAEPGIRYYLKNGSGIENFFKDKPLSLGLQFGLRVNISDI